MKLIEAIERLEPLVNKELGEILNIEDMVDIIKAKGKTGQLLEKALGLSNSSNNLDFEDGELKTNKCDKFGNPKETMFITQISSIIDDLVQEKNFYKTHLFEKISNILYVPICKEGKPEEWFFLNYTCFNINDPKFITIKKQLEEDYYSICKQIKFHIENSIDGYIHTSSGKYIQIRSKDSVPYRPIYSNIYSKNISNKNHAFYFKKEFMKAIIEAK